MVVGNGFLLPVVSSIVLGTRILRRHEKNSAINILYTSVWFRPGHNMSFPTCNWLRILFSHWLGIRFRFVVFHGLTFGLRYFGNDWLWFNTNWLRFAWRVDPNWRFWSQWPLHRDYRLLCCHSTGHTNNNSLRHMFLHDTNAKQ
jgi:hypothetical protein